MQTLTVFTPAYNRAHTIGRTYKSLCSQKCKDFVWLIVDDGSTDNTAELVKDWISKDNGFEIQYIYKENGGMHTAHNVAYRNIHTELNTCIDSDDALSENAVEKIINKWNQVKSRGYAGIIALDANMNTGKVIGKGFPKDMTETTLSGYYASGGSGDKKLIYRTDIINSVPEYPVFDNEKYLQMQSKRIKERISQFGGKLYLEFGGKLFDDYHASRVLPGFKPDSKINMLVQLKDDAEIVLVISAGDIEKNKVRGDLGITYDADVLRLIDAFRGYGLYVGSVVLTQFSGQASAVAYEKKLEGLGIRVYKHYPIEGYPANIPHIVSEDGFGKNDYIETERSLVVITAPGPGSGKMATCLSQLYHENKRGVKAGYAKFETFPIWNIPLRHPVNLAYEAATADLNDVNMIDPFHLEAYGETTINYNRDVEVFPVLNAMFEQIYGESPYKSPTDMGVNMVGNCIFDDEAVCQAARTEIVRRYYKALCDHRKGLLADDVIYKLELLMKQAGTSIADRTVVAAANRRAEETGDPAVAIELPDGTIVTGKTSALLGASSAMLLNALKKLAGIAKEVKLIAPEIIEPIQKLKVGHLGNRNPRLHTDEVLIALSICAVNEPKAALALKQLEKLKCCEVHSTVILSSVDENVFKKLGINLTCEARYETKKLFHRN